MNFAREKCDGHAVQSLMRQQHFSLRLCHQTDYVDMAIASASVPLSQRRNFPIIDTRNHPCRRLHLSQERWLSGLLLRLVHALKSAPRKFAPRLA
jgi:hypothetical protein